MDKIAVLIPCYNEAKTIEKVINDYKAALPDNAVCHSVSSGFLMLNRAVDDFLVLIDSAVCAKFPHTVYLVVES